MNDSTQQKMAIVCSACGGDPRTSSACRVCGGAGIGVPSSDGFLVWMDSVDAQHIALRQFRRRATIAFHLILVILILLSWITLVWNIAIRPSVLDVLNPFFWISGQWYVITFWAGVLLTGFLIFRLREFAHEEKSIPIWKMTHAKRKQYDALAESRAKHRFNVSPYFSSDARNVIESAWKITRDLRRTQVMPEMLFSATLTSPIGGVFMARLGMDFEKIKIALANQMAECSPAGDPPILLSRDVKRVLALAYADAREFRREFVGPTEIFLESFFASVPLQELLNQYGFPPEHVSAVGEWVRLRAKMREDYIRFRQFSALKPRTAMNRAMTARQAPLLDAFSEDITHSAQQGQLFPTIGRIAEMESVFQAIESGSRSVVLVGEAGVGKTTIVEGIARRMVEEDVPRLFFDKRMVSIYLSELLAGGNGEPAERLVAMLNEVRRAQNIILVLEGMESLSGQALSGPMDLAETLTTEIERGGLIVIGTTTPRAWTEFLEQRTVGSSCTKVIIPPLDAEQTLHVCMARSSVIEHEQKIFFSYSALQKAIVFAGRYLHDSASPQNAIEVINEAGVAVRKARGEGAVVTGEDVAGIVHEKTQIPVEAVSQSESEKLLNMETHLHGRIVGQEEAVVAVSQALRRARADIREGKKPIASFLFLGPTGVGKTELSKALASEYFGDEDMMIRVDMSEYQDADSVARMIGRSGDQRGGLLTEAVRKQPFALVLLDEVEKAHPDILNLFLQVMDDGRLTDGVGRTVDFINTIIIMTSNAGTSFIQAENAKGTPLQSIKTSLLERELRGAFRPEFLNRFDGVIVFAPLRMQDVIAIARLQMKKVEARLKEKGMMFRAEDDAIRRLAEEGYDPLFGARPLKRVIQERVENPLADLFLRNQARRGNTIVFSADGSLKVE